MSSGAFILEIPDTGNIQVKIGGSTVSVDAYEVWNRIIDIRNQLAEEDKPLHEFHAQVAKLLSEKGLPTFNHYQVDQFVEKLTVAVDELKKNAVQTPDSQASTAPVPSPCPVA